MFAEAFLPEFDREMATTRTLLERVPEASADWRPHPKSTSLGSLAQHVVNLLGLGLSAVNATERDMNPPGGNAATPKRFSTTVALLANFDENVAAARAAIAAASDEQLMVTWSLKNAGNVIFSMRRVAVLRTMMLNHLIHHRGQLTVYLRMLDVPLPSIYGPTADAPLQQ